MSSSSVPARAASTSSARCGGSTRDVEIAVAERALAGGECSYYACIPTKTLLRPGEALEAARLAPGAAAAVTGELDVATGPRWRDEVTSNRDDSWHAGWLAEQRAELVRGEARVARPGVVEVDGRELEYAHLVVATGSSPSVPADRGNRRGRLLDEPRGGVGGRRSRRASSSSAAARSASSSRSSSSGSARG